MRNLFLFIICFFALQINAQVSLSGKVFENENPLEFATVVLTDTSGQIAGSEITNAEGTFNITVTPGDYLLEISFIGLSTYTNSLNLLEDRNIDAINMFENSQKLDEVTIVAKKRLIEQKPDRLIFNVAGNISVKGGNAVDVLKLAPGLTVGREGISMIGRPNAAILIDGRPIQLQGEDLNNFIAGLAAEDIEKIEIISNPPAQYDAAGNGGLINIVLSKGRKNAWKNNTSLSYTQSIYDFYSISNQFNLNKDRLRFSASANAALGHHWENENLNITFPENTWFMDMNSKNDVSRISGKILLDYEINKKWTAGIQYLGNNSNPDLGSTAITEVSDASFQQLYDLVNISTRNQNVQSHALNFYNQYKIDSLAKTVTLDIDIFDYKNTFTQDNKVDQESPAGDFQEINLWAENFSTQDIKNQSAKLDFAHPLEKVNLSYGLKYSAIQTSNANTNYNLISGERLLDETLSDEFTYQESTAAIYFSASMEVSDKLSVIAGLRAENTSSLGFSKTLNEENKNTYTKLFPSLFTNYQYSEKSQFSLNYSRRINRPGFRDLNPFRIYINDMAYSEGNPFLQPSFSNNLDFTHNYNGFLSTNIYFNYLIDGFGTVFSADPSTQEQATIRRNYFQRINMGIGERISLEPYNWWASQNQIYLMQSTSFFDDTVDGVEQNGIQLYLSTSNSISLSDSDKLQLDFWFTPPHKSGIFRVDATYKLDISYRKSFMNGKWNLGLTLNDILDSASYNSLISEVNGIRSEYGQNYSSRNLRLTLSYNFGNKDISVKERQGSNTDERRRSN